MSMVSYRARMTVIDTINRLGKSRANNLALITETQQISYRELAKRIDLLAAWLLQKGAVKGDRVIIWGLNTPQAVEVMLVCAKLGLIGVPLNTRLADDEVEFIMQDTRPTFLFSDHPLTSTWSQCDSVRTKVSFYKDASSTINYELALKLANVSDNDDFVHINPDDPFLIVYTAAVSGKPKGAVLTQRNIVACNVQMIQLLNMNENDICGIFTPLYHIAGLSLLFSGLHLGVVNVLLPSFEASKAVWSIVEKNVSIFCSFSPMMQMILDHVQEQGISVKGKVRAAYGLESPQMIESAIKTGMSWYGIYAQTEVTGIIAAKSIMDPAQEVGLIGYPGFITHIALLNDFGNEVSTGEVGEICVRGETSFSGYWNRQDENDWIFRGGWLHTGDLAVCDEKGILWYKGRKSDKELIKTGGENVYPAEVEQIIMKHQAVERVYVIGVADSKWLESVKAVIQLKKGLRVSEADIQQFCKERMAGYKVPKIVQFVDTLPQSKSPDDRVAVGKLYG